MDTLGESHVTVQGPQASEATTTCQSITSKRLNGINFKTWSRSVVHYRTSKGVEGLVDGTYTRPAVTDEKKYTQWKKHNKTYSSKSNGSRVFQLYREVHSTSQGDQSAAQYFAQLQTRWEEIDHHEVIVELTGEAAMLVAKRADKQKVFAFLIGLRPEFETLGGQIINTRPFPFLMNAFATIDDDDRRRSIRQATLPPPSRFGIIIDNQRFVVDSSYLLEVVGRRGRVGFFERSQSSSSGRGHGKSPIAAIVDLPSSSLKFSKRGSFRLSHLPIRIVIYLEPIYNIFVANLRLCWEVCQRPSAFIPAAISPSGHCVFTSLDCIATALLYWFLLITAAGLQPDCVCLKVWLIAWSTHTDQPTDAQEVCALGCHGDFDNMMSLLNLAGHVLFWLSCDLQRPIQPPDKKLKQN
ncbi:hypothetical protein IFM89_036444 [Coptis chinensis]|uniref:Retrotransposon Copia-like N-terminal domain-containing protein n=1 Tax=Coptis chinensis TaxID=261450 RepID=A0A835LY61_9MAGN|nr:hypothetical protein IFM89_036444 [Coptis chinensis]